MKGGSMKRDRSSAELESGEGYELRAHVLANLTGGKKIDVALRIVESSAAPVFGLDLSGLDVKRADGKNCFLVLENPSDLIAISRALSMLVAHARRKGLIAVSKEKK